MNIVNSSYLDVSPVAVKLMFNVTQTQMRVDIGLLLVESFAGGLMVGARWSEWRWGRLLQFKAEIYVQPDNSNSLDSTTMIYPLG